MGDQDDKASVPEWQKVKASEPTTSSTPFEAPATIEQAKKFLQDEEVRRYPREKKIDFLKSKGLSDSDVRQLIEEETDYVTAPAEAESSPKAPHPDRQVQAEPSTLKTPPRSSPAPPEFNPDTDTPSPTAEPATVKTPPRSTPDPPEFQPDTNTESQSPIAEPATVPTPARTNPPPPDLQTNITTTDSKPQTESQSPISEPPVLKTPPRTNPPPSVILSSGSPSDRPPIVTYPEFLTKPARPPPRMMRFGR